MSTLLSVSATALTTILVYGHASGLLISAFVGAAVGFIMTFVMMLVPVSYTHLSRKSIS